MKFLQWIVVLSSVPLVSSCGSERDMSEQEIVEKTDTQTGFQMPYWGLPSIPDNSFIEEENPIAQRAIQSWLKTVQRSEWTVFTKGDDAKIREHTSCLDEQESSLQERWDKPAFRISKNSLQIAEWANSTDLGYVFASNSTDFNLEQSLLLVLDLGACDLLFVEYELVPAVLSFPSASGTKSINVLVHNPSSTNIELYVNKSERQIVRYTAMKPQTLQISYDSSQACSDHLSVPEFGQDVFELCPISQNSIWIESAVTSLSVMDFRHSASNRNDDEENSYSVDTIVSYAPSKSYHMKMHIVNKNYSSPEIKLGTEDQVIFR